jgi:hypothetical protein
MKITLTELKRLIKETAEETAKRKGFISFPAFREHAKKCSKCKEAGYPACKTGKSTKPKSSSEKLDESRRLKRLIRTEVRRSLKEEVSNRDIVAKAEHINSLPGSFKYNVMNQLEDMAEGGDAGGIRDEYYSEWSKGDFQKLLSVIKSGAPSTDGNTDLSPDSDKLAESRRRRNRRR